MKAKTYKSLNGWISPQSLSTFGIPISNGNTVKYLGLEEFNFSSQVMNTDFEGKKVAFIPCFSVRRLITVKELELFYLDSRGITKHYATLFNVDQIPEDENTISAIRNLLNQNGMQNYVCSNNAFIANYGILHLQAYNTWVKYFNSNNIIANGTNLRFVCNVLYDKIIFHNPHNIVNWTHLKHARNLYI